MELKEAFLDFFHFSLPLKEQIRNSEMPVVSVDFEGKVFKEDDRVIRYSWEAENGSWVKAYLIPNERTIYLCNNKFEKYVKRGLLVTINIEYYRYKINSNLIPYLTQNEFTDINSFSKALIESIGKSLNQEKSKEEFFMGTEKRISDLTSKSCYTPAITQVSLAQLDEMVNKVFDKLKNIDKCERVKRINHESYFVNYEFTYVASKEYSIKYTI